jgi:hypothetical protein
MKKAVLERLSTLLLRGTPTFARDIQPARANPTIYIRSDVSVDGSNEILLEGNFYTSNDDFDSIAHICAR